MIVILVLAGVVALSGAEAASNASCGDTITTDTTLHQDLVNCPNNGIVIGADDVTLDLNGHLIDGDGTPAAGCDPETEFCDIGVVNDGHDGVTVKHGSVREFAVGVFVAGRARHNRVLGISSSRNRLLRLRGRRLGPKPGPQQLGKRQPRSRRGRDGLVRLASRPDPAQLVPAQPRARHPRRRFRPTT